MIKNSKSFLDKIIFALTVCCISSALLNATTGNFTTIVIAISAICEFVIIIRDGGKIIVGIDAYLYFMLGFVGLCFLSGFWAYNSSRATSMATRLFENFLCGWVFYLYYSREANADKIIKVFQWNGYVISSYYLLTYGYNTILVMMRNAERISSELINANTVGVSASLSVVITLFLCFKDKKLKIWYVFTIPALVMTIASQSKKAFLFLIIGTLCVILYCQPDNGDKGLSKSLKRLLTGLMWLVVAISALQLPLFSGINNRLTAYISTFTSITSPISANSDLIRKQLIENGIEVFKQHPIIGVGIDNVRLVNLIGIQTHNNYVELLADLGIVGFAVYYSMFAWILSKYVKYKKHKKIESPYLNICFVILILRLVMEYGSVSYFSIINNFYLMLLFCEAKYLMKGRYSQ